MKQISTKEIVDLFAYNKDSAVLVEKRPLPGNAQYKVNYSVVNFATGEQEVITKSAYLLRKFGSAFQKISTEIPNFVQCDAAVLYDRRVLVIYPNGEAGIFDREGTLEWNGMFQYHDAPVKHLALELLRTVVDAKTPSETEAVPLVTTVFRVLQRSEQCRKCAKYLTYLLRRLSVFSECGWGE